MVQHLATGRVRESLALFLILAITLLMAGCGGHTSVPASIPTPASKSPGLLFASNIALDGSNGVVSFNASNVWFVNADGSGLTPLTKLTRASIIYPVWSPDGTKIAYLSDRALDGSDAQNTFTVQAPAGANVTDAVDNIWVINADGSGARPVTKFKFGSCIFMGPGPDTADCQTPLNALPSFLGPFPVVWSPDGSKLAFASWQALDGSSTVLLGAGPNIWVANTDGSGAVPVTRSTGNQSTFPAWSPDGSRIAFVSGPGPGIPFVLGGGPFNISVIHPDGSAATRLTDSPGAALFRGPLWSPDGTKIAFNSLQALDRSKSLNSAFNNWVINADGSGVIPLTRFTAVDAFTPAWSPDSTKIAFLAFLSLDGSDTAGPTGNIWMINADGSHLTPVTRLTHAREGEPVWSPDGAQLAFSSPRALDGNDANIICSNGPQTFLCTTNLWVVNVDGSGARPLTKLTDPNARSGGPQWRPR